MKNLSISKPYDSIKINDVSLILYVFVLLTDIFTRSMFFENNNILIHFRFVLIIMMLFISTFFNKHKKIEWIYLILGVLVTFNAGDKDYLLMILLLFSSTAIEPKKFLKATLITILISVIFIVTASLINLIPNLITFRNGTLRQALGMQYPLILSGYVFLAFLCFAMLKNGEKPLIITIIALILILFLDKVTNSRNDEICIFLVAIVSWLHKIPKKYFSKIVNISTIISSLVIFISIFITKFVHLNTNLGYKLDTLFSGRLSLQYTLFQYYKPSLLPQQIIQNGWGGRYTTAFNYFYIDNSFTRFFFMGGIIFSIIVFSIFLMKILDLSKNELPLISLWLLIICINGISSDSLSILTTNLLLPLFGISIQEYKKSFSDKC